jgi:DNA-directed RNA polymerase subunit RPC12/RpoP
MGKYSIMKDWFCKSCFKFFDLEVKHKNLTLDKIICPHCYSKLVYNGNFIAKAKLANKSIEKIIEICYLYDEMGKDLNKIPIIIPKLYAI